MASNPNVPTWFTNCRSVNMVFVYPNRFIDSGDELTFSGTSSPVAMWRYYTPSDVDNQIGYAKSFGFNCLRIWLSYFVWKHYEDLGEPTFLNNLADLVSKLEKHKVYACWVLFGGLINQIPGHLTGDPFDDIDQWTASPGSAIVLNETSSADFFTNPVSAGSTYIQACVSTVSSSPATVIYDMMNEPVGGSAFTWSAAEYTRQFDPVERRKITVGWAGVDSFSALSNNAAFHKSWDVNSKDVINLISFHPYSNFPLDTSVTIERVWAQASSLNKPVFASEGGSYSTYRPLRIFDKEMTASAIGWSTWVGMPDHASSMQYGNSPLLTVNAGIPFSPTQGLFHYDGTARAPKDLAYLQTLSSVQRWLLPRHRRNVVEPSYASGANGTPSAHWPSYGHPSYESFLVARTRNYAYLEPSLVSSLNFIKYHDTKRISFAALAVSAGITAQDILAEFDFQDEILGPFWGYTGNPASLKNISDHFLSSAGTIHAMGILTTQEEQDVSSTFSALGKHKLPECVEKGTCYLEGGVGPNYDYAAYDSLYTSAFTVVSGICDRLGWFDLSNTSLFSGE